MNPGDIVWTTDGRKVRYAGLLEGQHFAYPIWTSVDLYGEPQEWVGSNLEHVNLPLYKQEPAPVRSKSVVAAEHEIDELHARIQDLQNLETEMKRALDDWPALRQARDFLSGTLTHGLAIVGSDWTIMPLAKLLQENSGNRYQPTGSMRLLSLTGKLDPQAACDWQMNYWRDGSGAQTDLQAFDSAEAAMGAAREQWARSISIWRARQDHNSFAEVERWLHNFQTVFDWPADYMLAHRTRWEDVRAKALGNARAELARIEAWTYEYD